MAGVCIRLVKNFKIFEGVTLRTKFVCFNTNYKKIFPLLNNGGHRTLLTPASLNLHNFEYKKKQAENKYFETKETFITKMNELCNKTDKTYYIYMEDLKNMIYLCENKEDHLNLLIEMAKRYNNGDQQNRLSDFTFGPELMRLFHYYNLPDRAKEALFDIEEMKGFFNQVSSYVIVMTLFYNNGYYQDTIKAMQQMVTERVSLNLFPKANLILAMASCYQMNTDDSLKKAVSYINKSDEHGIQITLKAICFAAALALRRENFKLALEIASKPMRGYYILKNIKAEALVKLGKVEDTLPILRGLSGAVYTRSAMDLDDNIILVGTMNAIDKSLKEKNDKELLQEYSDIKKAIAKTSTVQERTIEECLCEPINTAKDVENRKYSAITDREKKRKDILASFQSGKRKNINTKFRRTGFRSLS